MIRMIFGLIFWVVVTLMVLAVIFTPLVILILFALTMFGGDDSLVSPLVMYGVFPAALIITAYLMYRYGRKIGAFVQSISL